MFQSLTGAFALSCSGAPKGATCTPNPASINLNGSTAVPVAVSVSTTASSLLVPLDPGSPVAPLGWPLLALAGLLASLAVAYRERRTLRRGFVGAALFGLLGLLAACGGSPAPPPPPPSTGSQTNPNATPAGTYTLTIAVRDNQGSVVGTSSLTLMAQ